MKNYFDKTFYMNLATEIDRKDFMEAELERVGLIAERIESVDGRVYDDDTGEQIISKNENGLLSTYDALCDSLLIAFRRAKSEGLDNFLVLEDDALFSDGFEEVMDSIFEEKIRGIEVDDEDKPIYSYDLIRNEQGEDIVGYEKKVIDETYRDLPFNWDILSLGYVNGQYASKPIGGRVHKLRQFTLGTAMAFSKSVYDQCIERLERKDLPSDVCLSQLGFENLSEIMVCGISTGIVTQREGHSDCIGRVVDAKSVD